MNVLLKDKSTIGQIVLLQQKERKSHKGQTAFFLPTLLFSSSYMLVYTDRSCVQCLKMMPAS